MANTPGPWTLGEENVGGGFNIYAGSLRVAHTSRQGVWTAGQRQIDEVEAKANARLIVKAVNNMLQAQARKLLTEQAQELDMGYGPASCVSSPPMLPPTPEQSS